MVPPVIIRFDDILHDKPSSYWGNPRDYGNPHILKIVIAVIIPTLTIHIANNLLSYMYQQFFHIVDIFRLSQSIMAIPLKQPYMSFSHWLLD